MVWLLPLGILPSFSCMFQLVLLHVVHFTISTLLFTVLPGDGSHSAFVFRDHCTCCRDLSLRINLDSPIPPHTTTLSNIQPLYLLGPCG